VPPRSDPDAPPGERIPNHPSFAELLHRGVVSGSAVVVLGGPQGRAFEVSAGDVLVLPAGTGQRRASASRGFTVVDAYSAGQEDYDLLRGDDLSGLAAARRRIESRGAPPPGTRSATTASPAGAEPVISSRSRRSARRATRG
jgi:uncharacterized protein YjlB